MGTGENLRATPAGLHHVCAGARFEHLPCGLCGADAPVPKGRRADGLLLVECTRCGLAYLDPMPDEASVRRLYSTDYFGLEGCSSTGTYRNYARSHRHSADPRRLDFRLIAENVGDLAGKRVLEVGCGLGDLLEVFQRAGCECAGVELNPAAADETRRRLGVPVFGEPLEQCRPQGFDIVVANAVLEHSRHPGVFLDTAAQALRPGGLLMLSSPNWDCAKDHDRNWVHWWGDFEHLCYFSRDVLVRACNARGLALVVEGSWGPRATREGIRRRTAVKRLKEFVKDVPVIGPLLLNAKRTAFPERLGPVTTELADYVALFRKVA